MKELRIENEQKHGRRRRGTSSLTGGSACFLSVRITDARHRNTAEGGAALLRSAGPCDGRAMGILATKYSAEGDSCDRTTNPTLLRLTTREIVCTPHGRQIRGSDLRVALRWMGAVSR